MRAAILTDKQWQFLHNYAAAHRTTLAAIAEHLLGTTAAGPRRAAVAGVDRKYIADRQRAADAIRALETFLDRDDHRFCAHDGKHAGQCRDANHNEISRLRHAIETPELLWRIYRRADRATGYTNTTNAAPARARKAA